MLLQDKTAVVFGAGGNLGKQVARAFIEHGAKVFISSKHAESMSGIVGAADVRLVDAQNEAEIDTYLASLTKDGVEIDILINLSGTNPAEYNHGKPAVEVTLEQFLIPMKTATGTQFITAKAGYKQMRRQKSGVIILITSTLAEISPAWTTALTSSHAATEGLVRTLASEWSPDGIRVIGIRSEAMPESLVIDYTYTTMGANIGLSREEMQTSVEEKVPLRRLPSASETAKVVVFAASDLASYMTGTTLNHSGGHVLD